MTDLNTTGNLVHNLSWDLFYEKALILKYKE